ncbi:MAG: acyl-CoA dehydrogenase, partial [Sphingobacteriaceae bacterium]
MHSILTNQLYQKIKENAAQIDIEGAFPEQEFTWLAEAGLLEYPLSQTENYPIKTASTLQLLKKTGSANLAVGRIYEGHVNALQLIALYGNDQQKSTWFEQVKTAKKLFSVWNTQADDGIKIHDLGDGFYRLEGSKTFCSGSGWIDRPLITGELISADKKGWQMCIIPTENVKPVTI